MSNQERQLNAVSADGGLYVGNGIISQDTHQTGNSKCFKKKYKCMKLSYYLLLFMSFNLSANNRNNNCTN